MSTEPQDGLPSADDLDAVAEEQRVVGLTNDTNVNKVNSFVANSCEFCGETEGVNFCRHCGRDYCRQHASKHNPSLLCMDCLSEQRLGLQSEAIVDEDGTTHQGRRIRLIGEGWPHTIEMIRGLSDDQLDIKIGEWKALLNEAIKTGEYFRITLAAAEYDKETRYRSKVRKLQRRREELQKQGAMRLNGKSRNMAPKRSLSPDEMLAQTLGITIEQAKQLRVVLEAQKKV